MNQKINRKSMKGKRKIKGGSSKKTKRNYIRKSYIRGKNSISKNRSNKKLFNGGKLKSGKSKVRNKSKRKNIIRKIDRKLKGGI